MEIGDTVRHKKHRHLGGVVRSIDRDYFMVKLTDGQTVTFLRKFLVKGHPEISTPESGLPEDVTRFRDEYIAKYQRTGKADLWRAGGSIHEFVGFGKFLKWLDANMGAT